MKQYVKNDKKVTLHHNVTALQSLNYKIGKCSIWMKRDDTLDFAFGGNKVRLFEYLIPDIIEKKYTKIATHGGPFSNHNRVAAAVASVLGIDCDIIVIGDKLDYVGGNRILTDYFNANLLFCSESNAYDFIEEYLNNKNDDCFWIPGGAHLKTAVFAYEDTIKETFMQAKELNIEFDAVYLPTGTGTTQAGVILGCRNTGIPVYGVTVARDINRCKREIETLLDTYISKEELESNINILESGYKYGMSNGKDCKCVYELAISDGIILDPIYNAKAFCMMSKDLQNKEYNNVLYINTGGIPNIFT